MGQLAPKTLPVQFSLNEAGHVPFRQIRRETENGGGCLRFLAFFRYSVGVSPVYFLNSRQKYEESSKPTAAAQSETRIPV